MAKAKWIVVTGLSGGIGRVLLPRLKASGYSILACGRRPLGDSSVVDIAFDIEKPGGAAEAVSQIERAVGADNLAGLINVAGILVQGPIELIPVDEFQRLFAANVLAPFELTRLLLPVLRRGRGRVINIGGVSARVTFPLFGPIAASKAALASLSETMRLEFAPFGVRVILIEPGLLRTSYFASAEEAQEKAIARNSPDVVMLYKVAIVAWKKTMARAPTDEPEVAADWIMRSLRRRWPKPRVAIGRGAYLLASLAYLPASVRDRFLRSLFGYSDAVNRALTNR